jgi:hypothetical protein
MIDVHPHASIATNLNVEAPMTNGYRDKVKHRVWFHPALSSRLSFSSAGATSASIGPRNASTFQTFPNL